MLAWAKENAGKGSAESGKRWIQLQKEPERLEDGVELRKAMFDFIADFSNWDNATDAAYLKTARELTQAAHEALGGEKNTKPLVVDPFAGGGSIPLEALRVGADAFASDLNPVAVLLNKVVLEYIPRYGKRLSEEVRKWGAWVKAEAEKELGEYYPKDADGSTPIAYLWARTIRCEGPGCGAEVPLIRSLWLAKKDKKSVALQMVPNPGAKRVEFRILVKQAGGKWVDQEDDARVVDAPSFDGTVKRGSGTCPCCGYTTPVARIAEQLKVRKGGADDARLMCVVTSRAGEQGRAYRLSVESDLDAVKAAAAELSRRVSIHTGALPLIPNEPLPPQGALGFRVQRYGMKEFGDLFTRRQLLALTTLAEQCSQARDAFAKEAESQLFLDTVRNSMALVVDRQVDYNSSLCRWVSAGEFLANTFGRQALSMIWDFAEVFPFSGATGDYKGALEWLIQVYERNVCVDTIGNAQQASASNHPLPSDMAQGLFSDPPYYDAVPYSDLSDFFHVWLKRSGAAHTKFPTVLTPKDDECIVDEVKGKDRTYFETTIKKALAEGRRVLAPNGIGVIVFAHKSTAGWEALLQAMIDAGWIITGSWPIDTERPGRLRSQDSAALASSIHLVCRPRENPDGSLRNDNVGDFRTVLAELPKRIHAWMPRLAHEGVVGADAIFACLGPALEIFSQYARVEKADGSSVELKEYLEHVWAAVSREALRTVLHDGDSGAFEADARLTVMWLWTLSGGASDTSDADDSDDAEDEDSTKPAKITGFVLEFDAARKIAQGLGAKLEELQHIVHVKGDKARLLPVSERSPFLFGRSSEPSSSSSRGANKKQAKKQPQQQNLFASTPEPPIQSQSQDDIGSSTLVASTSLDRVHQAMLLFASGRSEALKRFLVEDGIGALPAFWKLAQALSALYPTGSDEKRWVDGVLARKKGLGFG